MFFFKPKAIPSTPLSDFIRNASSEEKKRVYAGVLKRAAEAQREVIVRVGKKKASA